MIIRKTPLKRKSKPKKRSSSFSSKTKELHEMYSEMDQNADRVCSGCGTTKNLSHSHILSRKDHELMSDPKNVTYHCLPIEGSNGCSNKWENVGYRTTLLDYIQNMEYIRSVRPMEFERMIIADHEHLKKNSDFICLSENFNYICKEFKLII